MKRTFRRILYVLAGIASIIVIATSVKTGIDNYRNKDTTPVDNETAQVQVVDMAA